MTTTDRASPIWRWRRCPAWDPPASTSLLQAFDTPLGALSAPFAFLCAVPGYLPAPVPRPSRRRRSSVGSPARGGRRAAGRADPLARRRRVPGRCCARSPTRRRCSSRLGNLALLERPALAVVGSRDHTAYGETVARRSRRTAARAGIVVVSGMARGLDAVAHAAALDAGGATIGVLGNGLGVIYPAANRRALRARGGARASCSPSSRRASGRTPAASRAGTG